MGKIAKFLFVFLFIGVLDAGSFDGVFADFDKNFNSAKLSQQQKIHNELKNTYLKTKNKSDKIETLKRLIYSSDKLRYSSQTYQKELKRLGGKYDYKVKNKEALVEAEIQKIAKNSKNLEKTEKLDSANAKLFLKDVVQKDNQIWLKFNRMINEKEFKKLTAKDKNINRFIIDFNGDKSKNLYKITNSISDEIRFSNYDPKTIRIVFNDKNKLNLQTKISNNYLIISNPNSKNNAPVAISSEKSNAVVTTAKYTSTKGKIIVIDPGHGGKDGGASGNNLHEKTIVLNTAKKLGELLKKRGYKVHYTRANDTFINLKSRTAFANKKNADMFISLHANAAPNAKQAPNFSGIETFFLSPARSERSKNVAALENKGDLEDMNEFSQATFLNFLNREKIIASNKLAIDIQGYMLNAVQSKFKSKDGGVREAPFWVLVGAQMPAVLVEMGYISHPDEGKLLGKNDYQNAIANGIANGVDAYFQKNK